MKAKLRLAVGIPSVDSKTDGGHNAMWLMFGHALCANEDRFDLVSFRVVSMNPVSDARNELVEDALRNEADWLLQCDADNYVEGEDTGISLLQMIADAEQHGAALVGAGVRARGWKEHQRTVWMKDETPRILSPHQRAAEPTMSIASEEAYLGKLVPCERIGSALTAVNLNWLRAKMPDPPWYAFSPMMVGPRETRLKAASEDVNFCTAVRARDGLILVDGRILPKHVLAGERI